MISHIGFEDKKLKINHINAHLVISLVQKENLIDEVIVMPENTLRKLLKDAFNKIPENYPTTRTKYTGFYRESTKGESNQYLSFSEAYIESVRGSISQDKDKGQIKILRSTGGYLPNSENITRIRFYGGIFLSTTDFVQKKLSFINPAHFDQYKYLIQKYDNYYKIVFNNKSPQKGYSGYFILDPVTNAYLEAKYKVIENNSLSIFYEKKEKEYFDKFIMIQDKYYLKYRNINAEGYDKQKKQSLFHFDEYLSTDIQPNSSFIIKESEQINFLDVFAEKVHDYSDSFWNDFNVIKEDSLLAKSKLLQISQNEENSALSKTKQSDQHQFSKILSNTNIKYGISSSSIHLNQAIYNIYLPEINQNLNKEIKTGSTYSFYTSLGYFTTKHLAIKYTGILNLSDDKRYNCQAIGCEIKKRINPFGAPNHVGFGFQIGQSTSLVKFGTTQLTNDIRWGGKTINSKKIDVFSGYRTYSLYPEINFYRYVKGLLSFYLNISYQIPLKSKEIITINEVGGLFNKSGWEYLDQGKGLLEKDNKPSDKLGISTKSIQFSIGININK